MRPISTGPFTVFAPTIDVSAAVNPATLNSILVDIDLLKNVLTYHVVASSLSADVIKNELTYR